MYSNEKFKKVERLLSGNESKEHAMRQLQAYRMTAMRLGLERDAEWIGLLKLSLRKRR